MVGAGYTGAAVDWAWYDAYACFLNEVMAYGCTPNSSSRFDIADGNHQFALFRIAKEYLSKPRLGCWLSAVASSTRFCRCSYDGNADMGDASGPYPWLGARPYFLFA
jgi:hypothetical protein